MTHVHLISRPRAAEREMTWYFTGEPCVRGHVDLRRVKDKRCCSCDREKARQRYYEDDRVRARVTVSNARRRELDKSRRAERSADPEVQQQRAEAAAVLRQARRKRDGARKAAKYANDPVYREAVNARNRAWHAANVDKATERVTYRRQKKANRTPPWLTPAMRKNIRFVYAEARRLTKQTGVEQEVDHIVPLQGELVSGLHVPWNLRVVTRHANRSKHNRFEEDPKESQGIA